MLTIDALSGKSEGGFAIVYIAFDDCSGERIALKVARDAGSESRARLKREFDLLRIVKGSACFPDPKRFVPEVASSVHPELDGKPAIVMEFVTGNSLENLAQAGARLSTRKLRRLALAMMDAGAVLQGHGIVHRDLHPGNIIVEDGGAVRIIDFGVAALESESDRTALQNGFEPPEAHSGIWSRSSDVYSLAKSSSVLRGRISSFGDAAFSRWLDVATASNPQDRFAGCREAASALRAVL